MNSKNSGWINGFIGMLIFSGSLPATRIAVADFDPVFLTLARASIAALLALVVLKAFAVKRPVKGDLVSLIVVSFGVVIGFPLLTAYALQYIPTTQSIVFVGLLPLMTAIFGILRGDERPGPAFWIFSCLGSGLVIGFALSLSGVTSAGPLSPEALIGCALMLVAIVVCGLGYAEGARLSRRLGGWQVISWALVLSMPITLPLTYVSRPESFAGQGQLAWFGLAYVSLFSMLLGFVFWYRGLAQGGIAAVGQLQLLQPFFGLVLAAVLLQETVGWAMVLVAAAVALCVTGAKRFA
ncbi:DMT family transporter [Kiloniella laminariae]|uniref:DMT family transporter n=2 Tax=Kiloniella laminariae TaxID=454162 RepID=A0ABT4LEF9_9PROT|nr:DMT family transporter [Kiloniella laminariae]MCZ4279486.1 DMT family transporter [Kiloniella laminariae]